MFWKQGYGEVKYVLHVFVFFSMYIISNNPCFANVYKDHRWIYYSDTKMFIDTKIFIYFKKNILFLMKSPSYFFKKVIFSGNQFWLNYIWRRGDQILLLNLIFHISKLFSNDTYVSLKLKRITFSELLVNIFKFIKTLKWVFKKSYSV